MVTSKRSRTPSLADEQTESPEILEGAVTVPLSERQRDYTVPFLEQCSLCKKKLSPEKNTFMYDDSAFCSEKCRERQRISDKLLKLREEKGKKAKTCSVDVKEAEAKTIPRDSQFTQ